MTFSKVETGMTIVVISQIFHEGTEDEPSRHYVISLTDLAASEDPRAKAILEYVTGVQAFRKEVLDAADSMKQTEEKDEEQHDLHNRAS